MKKSKTYEPRVLVDTSNLSREAWPEYRRLGIGGSDAAAILGISPFRTARDLYYDKLNIVTADSEENWVAKEVGNLLEPLVAKIFAQKTGLKVFQRKCMFQHPHYPWMLADLDYLTELPDGRTAIVEIKTTNYNARDNWWYNGEEIVPIYYESQARHYMSVMNIDRTYFCCLYGNNEDQVIIRHLDRDMDYEEELIALEQTFWNDHVVAQVPPPYTEDGELILESLRRQYGASERDAQPATFAETQFVQIMEYLDLQAEKSELDASLKKIKGKMERLKALLVEAMGKSSQATYMDMDGGYKVTFQPSRKHVISKEAMERMKEVHPDIYQQYVSVSESRRFYIKELKPETA